jgi:hypothetical protein
VNWRWIAPAALGLAFIEGLAGVAVYSSQTWNWDHTKILTGWAAVRLVCLVYGPLALLGIAGFAAMFFAALDFAAKGRRQ